MPGPLNWFTTRLIRAAGGLALAAIALAAPAQDIQDANRLVRAGQYGAALERIEAVLAKNPRDAQARFLKGVVLSEQGKANEAIAVFQALSEDYPELPEPYNNLASLFAGKGQYEKAKTALEMAIQINPGYATAYENLGDVYAKMASQAYDKAAQLDKANVSAQGKLAAIRGAFAPPGKAAAPPAAAPRIATPPPAVPAPAPVPASPKAEMPKSTAPALAAAPTVPAAPGAAGAAAPAQGDDTGVIAAVNAWAEAWSTRNLAAYLAAYSKSFTPDGQSREAWEAVRRSRFPASRPVQVAIGQPHVSMLDADRAEVTFHQQFRSDRVKLSTRKSLLMAREDGGWHIAKEHIVP
jgi:tetratricopeptide (TPR) repeat protein